jgi:hypothetical protein
MIKIPNAIRKEIKVEQPHPFVNNAPNFLCLPLLVKGIPVFRDILCFARVIPRNRFQENPPLLGIVASLS